jgi:hypothetical protein
VAAGAAEDDAAALTSHQDDFFGRIPVSNWRFGPPAG